MEEAFAASMAFCEAPFEGTSALPVRARSSASASSDCQKSGGDAVRASSSVAAFAASMAFCEAPFEGTVARQGQRIRLQPREARRRRGQGVVVVNGACEGCRQDQPAAAEAGAASEA
jgi:hypothetical protein